LIVERLWAPPSQRLLARLEPRELGLLLDQVERGVERLRVDAVAGGFGDGAHFMTS
jgi:hypothetical protein